MPLGSGASQSSFWKWTCIISLVSLAHCAYSAAQHRSYLRLTHLLFTTLPVDIVVQTLLSLLLVIFSATMRAGDFQAVKADTKAPKKSWDSAGNCPSFMTFEHRAKCLSPMFNALDE